MSAQETGEAILYVIKKLFKWLLMSISVILILWGFIYLGITFIDWYQTGRHESKVIVDVKFDKSECDTDYPLSIFVGNNSTKSIKHISIYVDVTNEGYSNKINTYSSFDSDKIIKPNEGYTSCWKIQSSEYNKNLNGENMIVSLDHFSVRFD